MVKGGDRNTAFIHQCATATSSGMRSDICIAYTTTRCRFGATSSKAEAVLVLCIVSYSILVSYVAVTYTMPRSSRSRLDRFTWGMETIFSTLGLSFAYALLFNSNRLEPFLFLKWFLKLRLPLRVHTFLW